MPVAIDQRFATPDMRAVFPVKSATKDGIQMVRFEGPPRGAGGLGSVQNGSKPFVTDGATAAALSA